jgi:hypothetical protein
MAVCQLHRQVARWREWAARGAVRAQEQQSGRLSPWSYGNGYDREWWSVRDGGESVAVLTSNHSVRGMLLGCTIRRLTRGKW